MRPRVLTYIRKSSDLAIQQRRSLATKDLLWTTVNGYTILNIYRAPNTDQILDYILSLAPPRNCLIGGDFNVHHDFFDSGVAAAGRGGELANWSIANTIDSSANRGFLHKRRGMCLISLSLIFRI